MTFRGCRSSNKQDKCDAADFTDQGSREGIAAITRIGERAASRDNGEQKQSGGSHWRRDGTVRTNKEQRPLCSELGDFSDPTRDVRRQEHLTTTTAVM